MRRDCRQTVARYERGDLQRVYSGFFDDNFRSIGSYTSNEVLVKREDEKSQSWKIDCSAEWLRRKPSFCRDLTWWEVLSRDRKVTWSHSTDLKELKQGEGNLTYILGKVMAPNKKICPGQELEEASGGWFEGFLGDVDNTSQRLSSAWQATISISSVFWAITCNACFWALDLLLFLFTATHFTSVAPHVDWLVSWRPRRCLEAALPDRHRSERIRRSLVGL